MSSMNGGLVMLREMLPHLPPSEKKIATYILNNPRESLSLTAKELGNESATSSAAVIRLCKSLDLKGLQDLKLRVAGDLHKNKEHDYRDIEPNEALESIIDKMTSNSIKTIGETVEMLYTEELEKAVDLLKNAKTIHFIGLGASNIIAQDAQQKFLRIDKTAYAFSDMHLAATLIANADVDDVVVAISFSGETPEVARTLEFAKENNVHTISLTRYGNSVVSSHADIKLYTSATREPTFRSAATSSRIGQLQVIDILFMGVASSEYDQTVKHLDATRDAVSFLVSNNKRNKK